MPWSHCGNEVILDDETCPTCAGRKPDWTVEVERTRTLRLGSKKKRDELTGWLELELQDGVGLPVAGHSVEVTLPNGARRAGTTDEAGRLRLEKLPPGECRVELPGRRHLAGRWLPGQGDGADLPVDARHLLVLDAEKARLVAAWWAGAAPGTPPGPPPPEAPAPMPSGAARLVSAAWHAGGGR